MKTSGRMIDVICVPTNQTLITRGRNYGGFDKVSGEPKFTLITRLTTVAATRWSTSTGTEWPPRTRCNHLVVSASFFEFHCSGKVIILERRFQQDIERHEFNFFIFGNHTCTAFKSSFGRTSTLAFLCSRNRFGKCRSLSSRI